MKNIQFELTWLNDLEKSLFSNEPDPTFRLLLTMEFNPNTPANMLRISRKIAFELPAGIRHSLIRSYNSVITPQRSDKIQ